MSSAAQNNKSKRRTTGFQLTEDEIHNFIAHKGDGEEDSESDWDDLGEAELTDFLSSAQDSTKADNHKNEDHQTVLPPTTNTSKASSRQDVGVDMLFGHAPNGHQASDTLPNTSPCRSDDTDDETNGLGRDEDDDGIIPLNEYGFSIQQSLASAERRVKEKEVDEVVTRAINDCVPSTSTQGVSISEALAACAARRKKAISDLNNAQWPGNTVERPPPRSTALMPNTDLQSTEEPTKTDSLDCWMAVPTRLRVHRSRISSELWQQRTAERQVLSLGQFMHNQRVNLTVHGQTSKRSRALENQVVVGVIGSKLPPRRSRNDRIYSVWCLSDLDQIGPGACRGCVKLFLFGNCHEKLWKEVEGTVIAVLGPRIMSDTVAGSSEKDISITLESALHVMLLGHSPDFAICAATAKSGQQCFHVVNKSVCRYCDLHVKKAYFEASTSRPGFATTQHPVFGRRPVRRKTSGLSIPQESDQYSLPTSQFFMPTDSKRKPSSFTRLKLSATKLSAAGYQFDTATGLGTNPIPTLSSSVSESPGSTKSSTDQHQSDRPHLSSPERKLVAVLRRPSAGSLNFLKHLEMDKAPSAGGTDPNQNKTISNSSDTSNTNLIGKPQSGASFAGFFASIPKCSPKSVTAKTPCLPKADGFIDLGPINSASARDPCLTTARLRATALVQSRGGVQAMEQQAKRRRISNPVTAAVSNHPSPLSRVLGPNNKNGRASSDAPLPTSQVAEAETLEIENQPPSVIAKKQKAERLAALALQVRQGSAHADLIAQAESQEEQSRLASLEKRDELQQKLVEQSEEPCTYVHCKTCDYRAWKAAPDCRRSEHQLVYIKGTKRYFRCRRCTQRTVTFERYPNRCCNNCGESLYEKTGILAERKVPNLPGEKLLPRGLEEKFL